MSTSGFGRRLDDANRSFLLARRGAVSGERHKSIHRCWLCRPGRPPRRHERLSNLVPAQSRGLKKSQLPPSVTNLSRDGQTSSRVGGREKAIALSSHLTQVNRAHEGTRSGSRRTNRARPIQRTRAEKDARRHKLSGPWPTFSPPDSRRVGRTGIKARVRVAITSTPEGAAPSVWAFFWRISRTSRTIFQNTKCLAESVC